MIEGNISAMNALEDRDAQSLQQLRWSELVAQFAATRDLRAELLRSSLAEIDGNGRFASLNASRRRRSEADFNLNNLRDEKAGDPTAAPTRFVAGKNDRETQ